MEIRFITDWRFEATVDGEVRTFVVTNPVNAPTGKFLIYVDEAKAMAGEYEVLVGSIVEEDGRTLLTEAETEDPLAAHLISAMRRMTLISLLSGDLSPITTAPEDDEDEAFFDEDDD